LRSGERGKRLMPYWPEALIRRTACGDALEYAAAAVQEREPGGAGWTRGALTSTMVEV
jgi:hypothetical protein